MPAAAAPHNGVTYVFNDHMSSACDTSSCVLLPHNLQVDVRTASEEVLSALRRIIDPDFGEDIVSCGFVKSLNIDPASGAVSFTLELTTPACPVKDQFKREAMQYVQVRLGEDDCDSIEAGMHMKQLVAQRTAAAAAAGSGFIFCMTLGSVASFCSATASCHLSLDHQLLVLVPEGSCYLILCAEHCT